MAKVTPKIESPTDCYFTHIKANDLEWQSVEQLPLPPKIATVQDLENIRNDIINLVVKIDQLFRGLRPGIAVNPTQRDEIDRLSWVKELKGIRKSLRQVYGIVGKAMVNLRTLQ